MTLGETEFAPPEICGSDKSGYAFNAQIWTPTRTTGKRRLDLFLPAAGRAYTQNRNIDHGPQDRGNVSCLSPWIRRRLILEQEVLAAVVARHGYHAANKFIDELFWRAYWKGFLELRPQIFVDHLAALERVRKELAGDDDLRRRYEKATRGETGIACFDAWTHELLASGYLHNHARMWFASIWIFTLRLPWRLGADFFYRHLLDADVASNTLSWRWVAGLQTVGKHYVATAENIRVYTNGRFHPRGQLNEVPAPLVEAGPAMTLGPAPLSQQIRHGDVALLLTEEDLHPESLPCAARVRAIAALEPTGGFSAPATAFRAGAISDGLARAQARFAAPNAGALGEDAIADWATAAGVREIVTLHAPVGFTALALERLERRLKAQDIRLTRVLRDWDAAAWPHATAGFFSFRKKIPLLVHRALARHRAMQA